MGTVDWWDVLYSWVVGPGIIVVVLAIRHVAIERQTRRRQARLDLELAADLRSYVDRRRQVDDWNREMTRRQNAQLMAAPQRLLGQKELGAAIQPRYRQDDLLNAAPSDRPTTTTVVIPAARVVVRRPS